MASDQFVDQVEATLSAQAISGAEVCRRLGRAKTDGRVRRTLTALQAEGRAVKGADGWQKPEGPTRGGAPPRPDHAGYLVTRYRAERDWWQHFMPDLRAFWDVLRQPAPDYLRSLAAPEPTLVAMGLVVLFFLLLIALP